MWWQLASRAELLLQAQTVGMGQVAQQVGQTGLVQAPELPYSSGICGPARRSDSTSALAPHDSGHSQGYKQGLMYQNGQWKTAVGQVTEHCLLPAPNDAQVDFHAIDPISVQRSQNGYGLLCAQGPCQQQWGQVVAALAPPW